MEIHVKLTIDDRFVTMARGLRRLLARRATLGTVLGLIALCALSGAVAVMAAPVAPPHTFKAGDPIRASQLNENFAALYAELDARVIRADTMLEAADCAGLIAALASLDDKQISSNATVTIKLAAGNLECASGTAVIIDHRDGGHIQIVGQGSANTTLAFFGSHGFVVPRSRSIGLIDKLTIKGSGSGGSGVMVYGAASATVGSDTVVREFENGIKTEGGWVMADGVISENNAYAGFGAYAGGFISAHHAAARDNGTHGFDAILGAAIRADGASAERNLLYGFDANVGSAIGAIDGPSAIGNKHGFNANAGSAISVVDASAASSEFGFAAWNMSCIQVNAAASNSNSLAGFSARLGSYVHVSSPTGDSITYSDPGANMQHPTDFSFVQQD